MSESSPERATATGLAEAERESRTLAPPARRTAGVRANEPVGAYRLLSVDDPGGPADPRPGQFYMLAAAERWGGGAGERPYLPRAFSFARARPRSGGGAELEFLLEAVGPGTERLGGLAAGEGLHLVGPLGTGFRVPADAGDPEAPPSERPPVLLVGGGIGAAPLLALQEELGPEAPVLLGFRSAAYAAAAELFAGAPRLATDDGSAGRHGLVTALLDERLSGGGPALVCACGPPAMLEAVRSMCAARTVAAQLALESGMACGFGACFGCVAPTRHGYVRLCVDGPVLDAAALDTALFPGAGHG